MQVRRLKQIYSFILFTKAVILRMVFSGSVLAVTVTVLVCFVPACPFDGVNTTSILPLCPGIIGSLGKSGTVQPQEPLALVILSGSLPELVKLKE